MESLWLAHETSYIFLRYDSELSVSYQLQLLLPASFYFTLITLPFSAYTTVKQETSMKHYISTTLKIEAFLSTLDFLMWAAISVKAGCGSAGSGR